MKITIEQVHYQSFDSDEIVVSAGLVHEDKWAILFNSGKVFHLDVTTRSFDYLFTVAQPQGISYSDGGFDISALTSVYTMDSVVAVTNDTKTHFFVHKPGMKRTLHLRRADNYARLSPMPLALYKDDKDVPHLIYSTAWNRLHIMNLDTLEILTAAKSLITTDAEERHQQAIRKFPDDIEHPWPTEYDYFYGEIKMSPDKKHFMSLGWAWGSSDAYTVYNLEDFIKNPRISVKYIGQWEHSNRAACWVDNHTVAVLWNGYEEAEEGYDENSPIEVHLFDIHSDGWEPTKRIPFDAPGGTSGSLYYYSPMKAFVLLNKAKGIIIFSEDGTTLLRDTEFTPDYFYPDTSLFITTHPKAVAIHRLAF